MLASGLLMPVDEKECPGKEVSQFTMIQALGKHLLHFNHRQLADADNAGG
jgi:hypothetical protein